MRGSRTALPFAAAALLLALLALPRGVHGQDDASVINCRAPAPEFPDIHTRCDKAAECGDYCARNQLSFDFLCCEDGTGWVAAHILNPLLFYMFWQDAAWTALVVLLFEVLEVTFVVLAGGFVIFPTTATELETWAGSLLGDGLAQGGLGLLLGVLIAYTFRMPPLVSTLARVRAAGPGARGRRARYIAYWALQTTLFLLLPWTNAADTVRYGLYACAGVQLLLLLLLYPRLLFNDWPLDGRLLWGPAADPALGGAGVPRGGFWAWALCVAALSLSTAGWQYLANDWFQVWLTAAVLVTLLTAGALLRAASERDGYRVVLFCALYLLVAAAAVAIIGESFSVPPLLVAVVPMLFIVLAVCICNTALLHTGVAKTAHRSSKRFARE